MSISTAGVGSGSEKVNEKQFKCETCKRELGGDRYIQKDNDYFCVPCYEERYSNTCHSCASKIRTDSKDLGYLDRHWHERCFLCEHCKEPLVEKLFGCHEERLYCDSCYDNLFGLKCEACCKPFKAGMKKLEWNEQQWHEDCFKCTNCSTVIGCSSFLPKSNQPYCVQCFNNLFAPKCTHCSKAIMKGGVLYKNEPYHRDCFKCSHCAKKLNGLKFVSKEDKPYCSACHAELFAKRCTQCTKPITGSGGGTKFISFEGRNWHNECFNCSCSTCGNISLVGKGFVIDQENVLCATCGKLPHNKRTYSTLKINDDVTKTENKISLEVSNGAKNGTTPNISDLSLKSK